MNKGLWIARKNYLFCLMKRVCEGYGGNWDEDKEIFEEVLGRFPNEKIEQAIDCYYSIANKFKLNAEKEWKGHEFVGR